jgi:hypothetical protein
VFDALLYLKRDGILCRFGCSGNGNSDYVLR